jgi:pimeloyl-ACP methyl ester carboxylesterase
VPEPANRQRVVLNGRSMSFIEAGRGEPLVLLHAFPLNADMWQRQLSSPPLGWRVVAPDLRGFGPVARNGHPPAGKAEPQLSMDDYAGDVVDLLDHLRLEHVVFCGLSMGGYVLFALYRRAARYVRGMILADTRPGPDTDQAREGRRQMQKLVDDRGVGAVADQMLPKLLAAERATATGMWVRSVIESNGARGIKHALSAMMTRPDSTPLLSAISEPTAIIVGASDGVTPVSEAEQMHAHIPRSTLTVIPEAGHLSNVDRPADFNAAVERFLLEKC